MIVNPHDWQCMFTNCTEVDHNFRLKSESFGDPGVINGTGTDVWMECEYCGMTQEAGPHDLDDDYRYMDE